MGKSDGDNVPQDKTYYDKSPLERDLSPDEFMSLMNSMAFSTDRYANGVLRDVDEKELQKWLSNPDRYKDEIQRYGFYQYITQGDIFALFDLVRVLPNLNYNIKTITPNKSNQTRLQTCRKALNEINHKELTRDIISQLVSTGTVVGLWVGREDNKKENPYCLVFDDLEFFFPGRRVRGKWTVWCDLSYFNVYDDYKMDVLDNLYPYVTMEDYNNFVEKGEEFRYIEFPIERSICVRTHTLRRNQRFGIPWNTPSLFDVKHKQKLRNLEKVASNKVMNAVAVLTMGIKDSADSTWKKLGKKLTKSTFDAVKRGLSENKDGEASVVGLPEWGKLEYPDTNVDEVLDPAKINSINDDIGHSTGIARGLTTGKDTTYAVAKLDLDIIFNRIGEILENVENEVYNKFLKIILPSSVSSNFIFEYEKTYPLGATEKLTALQTLATSGYTVRPLVELLGLDFQEYIDQSIYEIEELKLREKIIPPLTSYTATGEDVNGTNASTENSKENNDSKSPRPSTS